MSLTMAVAGTVWVLSLFNVFNQREATLPEKYNDENACKIASIQKGYSNFSFTGVHGKCEAAVTVGNKLKFVGRHAASRHAVASAKTPAKMGVRLGASRAAPTPGNAPGITPVPRPFRPPQAGPPPPPILPPHHKYVLQQVSPAGVVTVLNTDTGSAANCSAMRSQLHLASGWTSRCTAIATPFH